MFILKVYSTKVLLIPPNPTCTNNLAVNIYMPNSKGIVIFTLQDMLTLWIDTINRNICSLH